MTEAIVKGATALLDMRKHVSITLGSIVLLMLLAVAVFALYSTVGAHETRLNELNQFRHSLEVEGKIPPAMNKELVEAVEVAVRRVLVDPKVRIGEDR